MSQLNKAKEAVENMRSGGESEAYRSIAESLLSIAISLDEKNKLDRESRSKDDEQAKETYDQSERMVKKLEALQEAQRKHNEPQNPTCYYCGNEITGSFGLDSATGGRPFHQECYNEELKRNWPTKNISDKTTG